MSTPRAQLALLTLLVGAVIVVAALTVRAGAPHPPTSSTMSTTTTTTVLRPGARALRRVGRQDRLARAGWRAQRRIDRRHAGGLLPRLPVTERGVRVDIAGSTSDGRILLRLTGGPSLSQALAVYRRLVRAAHDDSSRFLVVYAR